jgi:hypothetical protein
LATSTLATSTLATSTLSSVLTTPGQPQRRCANATRRVVH